MEIIWLSVISLLVAFAPSTEGQNTPLRCRNQGCDGQCYKYPPPANLDCAMNSGCFPYVPADPNNVATNPKGRSLLESSRQKTDQPTSKLIDTCWCCTKKEIPSGKCLDDGCSKTFMGQGECVNVTSMPWSTIEAKYDLQKANPYYNRRCKAPAGEENCCLCLKKSSCEDTGCFQKGGICVDMRNSLLAQDNLYPRNVVDLNSRIRGDLCRGTSSPAPSGEKCCQCYKRKSKPCPPAEIAFVVDRSGSMLAVWTTVVTWLEALVDAYEIDGITRKGGLVAWSSSVHAASTVLFTDNLTGDQLKDKIALIPSPVGATNGAVALDYTYDNLFATGSDPTVFREIIFISDGVSETPLAPSATQFHTNSIRITAVALGDFDTTQINSMLCTPCGDRFFVNEDFDELNSDEFLAELADC